MRGYIEASLFPFVEVGGVLIPRVIMGHLPFMGVSYQGIEKDREYYEEFSHVENTVKVLSEAVDEYGVTVIAAMLTTSGPHSKLLLEATSETMRITDTEIAIIPCIQIPLTIDGDRVDDYKRWSTYYSIEQKIAETDVYEKYLKDPILLCREGWGEKFPKALKQLRPYTDEEIQRLTIDYEDLKKAIAHFNRYKVLLVEPGSESDLLAMTGRTDLLIEFTDYLRDMLKCPIVIGTHHAGSTIPILEESDIAITGYVTPVNQLGAMMFPTSELAMKAIKECSKVIIAVKPLAGGRISPDEAFKYVYREVNVDTCLVGVASIKEVNEDFSIIKRNLERKRYI